MSWTKDDQAKLNLLRGKELAGTLTDGEHAELAGLMARVEAEEAAALAPAMGRLRDAVAATADEIRKIEAENEALAEAKWEEGHKSGVAEGKRDSLRRVLEIRGVTLTDAEQDKISRCSGLGKLDQWLAGALTASAAADVFA